MGEVTWFLGLKRVYGKEGIYIMQKVYIEKVFDRFYLTNAAPKVVPMAKGIYFHKLLYPDGTDPLKDCPYREFVNCLLYLSLCTRPDISLAMSELSRFVQNHNESH